MKNFKHYQYMRIITKEGEIADGDYIVDDTIIIRVKEGFLNDAVDEEGTIFPAIETADGTHIEHWKDGMLHCENEPAVIDTVDGYEEWWHDGRQVPNKNTR
ncbi:hypothetical protein [Treponema sp. Marseille-Q4523]|uniref:hypothetical protein n=1 Tax=Treponema sp. Marseille-Q4523 TaxID=2810610 RepID=UPI0019606A7E|nr:hypothetical protein [Treponema sp. Marseille-Q4523]MBM7022657.1 hypothetical protein [Treponema sp. Marseille-Q4523]